jgi:tripartite-type tricarboxylate transporter receptor subunit TctC
MNAFRAAAFALVTACYSVTAAAQSDPVYPAKPLRLIVPFAAGGTTDTSARLVGRDLSKPLGQSIIVENRPGAGGLVGTEAVLKLPADGYTLALGTISTLAVLPTANPQVSYEPLRDFVPITQIATLGYVVAVHPSLPAQSLAQLAKLARAKPLSISFGSPGYATGSHLTSEYLHHTLGIKLVHVPYKGDGPGVADLLGGQIPMVTFPPTLIVPHVRSGRLRALAVTSAERSSALPDVQTVAELGHPGFESSSWHGIAVRSGTPEAIVRRLHKELALILARSAEVRGPLEASGARIVGGTPEEFAAYVREEIAKWKKVIVTAGIKIE